MDELLQALRSKSGEFIAWRRNVHQHPELAFQEHRTADLVAAKLRNWGYAVHTGMGGTGVVGQLVRGEGRRRLGLRADMDALPIEESTALPYASRTPGVMHACGHDGHTAMLLAAAEHLSRDGQLDGTLNLIFQPAEETGGGARRMIEDGLFDLFPCDAVFAMHNMPGVPQGQLVFREGAALASSDHGVVTLTGVGGHGAIPHRAADPVVAAASVVMALQTVVSRNADPLQTAVLTVGKMNAGTACNVIPERATLELSLRTLDAGLRTLLQQRIEEVVRGQAASYGVTARVEWMASAFPVLVNDPAATGFAREVALELLGPERVTPHGPPVTGSEDFAWMLERVPGSYLLIGNGAEGPGACMVHNPGYDFNDENLVPGAAYWVRLAERFLQR